MSTVNAPSTYGTTVASSPPSAPPPPPPNTSRKDIFFTGTPPFHRFGTGDGAASSREESTGFGGGLSPSPVDSTPSLDTTDYHPGDHVQTPIEGAHQERTQVALFTSPPPLPPPQSSAGLASLHPVDDGDHHHPTILVRREGEGATRYSSCSSTTAVSMPGIGRAINDADSDDFSATGCCVDEDKGKGDSQRRLLSPEDSAADFPPQDEIPMSPTTEYKIMRSAFFAVFPVFMAYAALVTLQGNLKSRIGISNDDNSLSAKFSFATSLCYLGNLIFRVMHNILFCKLTPRHRVCISYSCLAAAMLMLGLLYFAFDDPDNKARSRISNLGPVYVAYLLGGVAIGTFESNLLSVITPLGHGTKVWAQYGIPIGFNGISVGAFVLLASLPEFSVQLMATIYCTIGACNILGMAFFLLRVPDVPFESTSTSLLHFFHDLKRFREWVPLMWTFALSLALDMFAVSLCSALQQFIYESSSLPLFTFGTSGMRKEVIPRNVHRAVFNGASLIGDTVGRKLAYRTSKHIHPFWFLIATGLGVAAVLSKQPLLAPFGMLLVMFGNGSIYSHTTKYVDDCVDRRYNLIALSFWLFVGDAGSFIGANVVSPLRDLVGGD